MKCECCGNAAAPKSNVLVLHSHFGRGHVTVEIKTTNHGTAFCLECIQGMLGSLPVFQKGFYENIHKRRIER